MADEEDDWTRGLDEYEQEMVLRSMHCEVCGEPVYGTDYVYADSDTPTLLGTYYHRWCHDALESSQLSA